MEVGEQILTFSKAAEVSLTGRASISARYNRAKPHFPPTLTMVMEAVKSLDEKKGSSVIAIRRYILHKYPGVDPIRLKYYLKKALVKGLDKGYLIRPLNSSAQGATGRFKLVSEKSKRGKAKEVESSDGETATKPAKKVVAVAVKKPRSKIPSGKPGSARNPEEGKKKPKIAGPKTEHGSNTSKVPEKQTEKALGAAKAPKKESVPKTSHAKPASGPKKTTSKTKKEAKGPAKPKANKGAKPPPAEKAKVATGAAKKAKTSSVADSSKAKAGRSETDSSKAKAGRSETDSSKAKTSSVADSSKAKAGRSETKAAVPKTKNTEAKKRVTKGKRKEEATGVSDIDSEDM